MAQPIACLLILVLASYTQAEPYRLVVLPDTQFNSKKWPEQLTTMTEWIVKNQQGQSQEDAGNGRQCSIGTESCPRPTSVT